MPGTAKAATVKVKVKVLEGWAVYDGSTQRGGGQTLEVEVEVAEQWIAAGWVERVKPTTGSKR